MNRSAPFSLTAIQQQFGSAVYPDSFVIHNESAFWLEKTEDGKQLSVVAQPNHPALPKFKGKRQAFKEGYALKRCPANHGNSRTLRDVLTWLKPALLGLDTSAGLGDRLGLATPGHVRALRKLPDRKIAPIFAQQSIREMERACRSPEDVLNDATWGAFQGGWRNKVGADADHLKTPADIDACAAVGFTFYTIDPGAYVDNEADEAGAAIIKSKLAALPWSDLESSVSDLDRRYAGKPFDLDADTPLESQRLILNKPDIMRAAAKYGRAVAHVVKMARHLALKQVPYELEISVDETETPTSLAEHIYIACELKRLGVKWVSLAPRYVGRFEKGIDYIGDLDAIARHLAGHAAIARALGPYKLSLHSGSDKFSIYPLISRACGGLVHLKTAGTSYVEALRVVAGADPALFRDIGKFAIERYPEDRATYHVSAEPSLVPDFSALADDQLPGLIDDRNVRQVIHVTFGSVLKMFGPQLKTMLQAHEDAYYETLERHFARHLEPFLHKGHST